MADPTVETSNNHKRSKWNITGDAHWTNRSGGLFTDRALGRYNNWRSCDWPKAFLFTWQSSRVGSACHRAEICLLPTCAQRHSYSTTWYWKGMTLFCVLIIFFIFSQFSRQPPQQSSARWLAYEVLIFRCYTPFSLPQISANHIHTRCLQIRKCAFQIKPLRVEKPNRKSQYCFDWKKITSHARERNYLAHMRFTSFVRCVSGLHLSTGVFKCGLDEHRTRCPKASTQSVCRSV